jgi:hypothetical protein
MPTCSFPSEDTGGIPMQVFNNGTTELTALITFVVDAHQTVLGAGRAASFQNIAVAHRRLTAHLGNAPKAGRRCNDRSSRFHLPVDVSFAPKATLDVRRKPSCHKAACEVHCRVGALPGGGRQARGLNCQVYRSRSPTAVSASIISRFGAGGRQSNLIPLDQLEVSGRGDLLCIEGRGTGRAAGALGVCRSEVRCRLPARYRCGQSRCSGITDTGVAIWTA